jgi:hypothetical protein
MDAKGRPTKLEDIISADSLITVMRQPLDTNMDAVKAEITEYNSNNYSLEIRKAIREYIKLQPMKIMLLMIASSPDAIVSAYMEALIASIDVAIKQRAEVDELREMADR